jgi:hypothetical protein
MAAIGSTGIVRIWFMGQTRLMGHVGALTARQPIFHPEDRARMTIDAQLAEAGWLVQSREQMNLGAALGVAVRDGLRPGRLRAVCRPGPLRRRGSEA